MAEQPKRQRPMLVAARLNEAEHAAVLRAARKANCSVSEFIRQALFPAARTTEEASR